MLRIYLYAPYRRIIFVTLLIGFGHLLGLSYPAHADHVLPLRLAAKPFSPTMCKGKGANASIHIQVAKHRKLVLKRVPGQHIPQDSNEARQKDYVHYLTVSDLTNGHIKNGTIAFDTKHGVIFEKANLRGISRPTFIAQQPPSLRHLAHLALNTFLHIHSILNAAVDACRPHPAKVAYETDDEILRIEMGKLMYQKLVRQHNRHLKFPKFVMRHETGYAEGYVDPDAGKHANVSYQAMNPLNFYVPTSYP